MSLNGVSNVAIATVLVDSGFSLQSVTSLAHVLGLLCLALLFSAVPGTLAYLVANRRHVPCNRLTLMIVLMATFLSLALLGETWQWFHPHSVGAIALLWITVICGLDLLVILLPRFEKILSLPSANQLVLVNQVMQREINERKQAEATLKQLNEELEMRVEQRTRALQSTLQKLQLEMLERHEAAAALRTSEATLIDRNTQLEATVRELRATQAQLVQSEKMSSLGQMVAGIAHEINNPVNFIYGNLSHLQEYATTLANILTLYRTYHPELDEQISQICDLEEWEFIQADFSRILQSMDVGTSRIRDIVRSLRNFSRLDEAERKYADLHDGLDSTLMILNRRLKAGSDRPEIKIIKQYDQLPALECYPGQLNQVFMNLLANAIDALEEHQPDQPAIEISTAQTDQWITIRIKDNGIGMNSQTLTKVFDPFYTTKPVGRGTGLGLSISYQIIVDKHHGHLQCTSQFGQGTEFQIVLPVTPAHLEAVPTLLSPAAHIVPQLISA
ncbi:ATP-binding protein [Spirulina major CS-329]|uniref:sensor histidine kinase n=1 Tax=Spirulina TaxID=1154 RepID=UPI0023307FC7|nr:MULTISPECIES: ATP-binding protein [Spirulina]MDB9493500.1 ATP-binding protein [Spirulina subsalsa CS-330]MDB9505082.1 ATP-binding protein [Spirulina major CS-329]